MIAFYRRYGDTLAMLICDGCGEGPPEDWKMLGSGDRDKLIDFARTGGLFPIFAPKSGRYADIRDTIIGYEQDRRRKLERRADELRDMLEPEHMEEHGPSSEEVEEMHGELREIGEQLAELAPEDDPCIST